VKRTKEEHEAYIKEIHTKMLQDIADSKALIAKLMEQDLIDEDGYPTDAALDIVETWHWSDAKGWFDFIKSIWYMPSWGWGEGEADHEYRKDEKVYQYDISTAGWSGNESIISSMQKCDMMWHLNWVSSRRGGHYVFELKEFNE